ncbi:MAG TPA: hypothetical protein VEB64_09010, partial [Azospirillaceae bacterium]|nr:hypothetical protein [Azospirillaceae bacterium]
LLVGCAVAAFPEFVIHGPPIPRDQRPHGPHAPWNRPVTDLPRHADGNRLVELLWTGASDRPGNFNINMDEAFAVYFTEEATTRLPVSDRLGGALDGRVLAWHPDWRIPPGSDRKVILLDRAAGRELNLFQVFVESGRLRVGNGSAVPGRYDTYEGVNPPSRGAGIQYSAMLVRPFEIERGAIDHALAMSINNTDGTAFVSPASKLEHPGRPTGIPEGTRFALTISDAEVEAWIGSLPPEVRLRMEGAARTVARALRDYGWFITDTGGAGSFEFEARASAEVVWERLGLADLEGRDGKLYPRDLLDGLFTRWNIVALASSDHYPPPRRNEHRVSRHQPGGTGGRRRPDRGGPVPLRQGRAASRRPARFPR